MEWTKFKWILLPHFFRSFFQWINELGKIFILSWYYYNTQYLFFLLNNHFMSQGVLRALIYLLKKSSQPTFVDEFFGTSGWKEQETWDLKMANTMFMHSMSHSAGLELKRSCIHSKLIINSKVLYWLLWLLCTLIWQ